MIDIKGLSYRYPKAENQALVDISVQVKAGEFVLLAGPSGSGKSTFLRSINGLVPHFSGGTIEGKVIIGGVDAVETGPQMLSRLVGFVFQDPEAQNVLDKVEAEIAFGLENAFIPAQEMRLRVEEALNLVDLHNLRERRLDTLSGGERQRLAIAAAMALRPKILIMDEPTSQLDPQSAEEVLQSVVRLNEELGLTVILVEQRLERVARYADRLIYMEEGRIVVDAPVREAITKVRPTLMSPLTRLARGLDWQPVPLTIKEGLRFVEPWPGIESSDGFGQTKLGGNGHSPEPLLQARNLHFAYNGTPVLQGVGLMVRPGETVALLGRNGSGKSTLLRCLVGLLRPAKGSVWVGGESNQDRSVAEICKQVAYLPQTPDDLLFADTVAEELDITLSNHGCDITEMRESSERLLVDMGLGSQSQSYPRDLSVGQRQRVALGAVMVTRPRLLLLDEPTRGLDYESKRNLAALWQRWKEAGMGLLLVTHDVELVAQVADRVMVISEGEIIADGPAADVLTASSLFTPQVARLFPGRGWLTVEDALAELRPDEIG